MSAALKRPSVTRPRPVSTPRQNFTARSTKQPSLAARRYDPFLPITTNLGGMSAQCTFCQAKRWALKPASLCCCNGKVQLNPLRNPPEPLKTLYLGETCASKYFLQHTRKYKSLGGIQVTKFKARSAIEWVVCVACLMRKFTQIYFVDDYDVQAANRLQNIPSLQKHIVFDLQCKELHQPCFRERGLHTPHSRSQST